MGLVACGDKESQVWTPAAVPATAATTWWLDVFAGPAGVPFIAGGTPEQAALMKREGAAFVPIALPATPLVNWGHTLPDGTVYLVGNRGTILRGDGANFAIEPAPTDQDLWGVWGAGPEDVWAVGGNGLAAGQQTILRRIAGQWARVDVGASPRATAFFKVWGTGADNVYVVGRGGTIMQWNGQQWRDHPVGITDDLISLWGTGPDRIAVVGGRDVGVIVTWNGVAWRTETLAELPGLNGVWMGTRDKIHAVGVRGTAIEADFDTLSWSPQTIEPATNLELHAIFGAADGSLLAVGGNLSLPRGPFEGIVVVRTTKVASASK
jgi:hypothetical protein